MLGTLLGGHYKLVSVLGSGGFGRTYLAEDVRQPHGSFCVVKQFRPTSEDEKFLTVARRLFDKEVDVLERLGQHHQIPQFLDFFEESQEFYLVQEFIDGHPLSEEISQRKRFSEAEAIALLQDVLSVLDFVHAHDVIHRDIKPSNLIRRHSDGKIVLIDFGAVKEIHTQLSTGSGQTNLTVSIGTPGYTPTEQLAGKPRFCSDIYALGMTTIHALTGLPPSQLLEHPQTFEVLWQDEAKVSPGLTFILERMVRSHFSQRYPTARDVLQALQRLSALPLGTSANLPALLLPESLLHDQRNEPETQFESPEERRKLLKRGIQVMAIATIAITGLVQGLRQIGWVEPLERVAYDQLVRWQHQAPPDPRLLLVAITEADLQALQRPTPSDQDLATVLKQLEQHQPRVIGLDMHRELAQEPGHAQLLAQLQQADNLMVIMKLGSEESAQIPPPEGVPGDRIGFNDFPVDVDGIVRRNLMFASVGADAYYSFSLRTALAYLSHQGIEIKNSVDRPDAIQIGETVFPPLAANSGGYHQLDAAGYQVLLDYRSPRNIARQVSFSDVLQGRFEPDWVQDKVVLIGTTAASAKDLFYTPYSAGQDLNHQMPGVTIHAQMVSQILTSVLDGRSPFWFWSEWVEILWIGGWAIAGAGLVWFVRHPAALGASLVIVLLSLAGTTYALFSLHGWVPVAAPAIAIGMTVAVVLAYRSYWMQQQLATQFL
ncbi:CHASE2 domain-containing protein [Oculatella sp. LEGE 06141]|uniref:CHASE2 domain-containing protein n=1 Tax=Oculatella sp. LEGE 06141 TaxID=1828648 RepID=UPI00187E02A3|nr:CHASE2 domain-containing protein [Oculatella sp. LEGE 06141]MBE9181000.1 CHASE2 domain-containing protein [Oculatella sp. LEGE 06141]